MPTGQALTAPAPCDRGRWTFIRHLAEMLATMFVGMAVLGGVAAGVLCSTALMWAGVIPSDAVLAVQHGLMLSALVGVMLWRYEHYSRPTAPEATGTRP